MQKRKSVFEELLRNFSLLLYKNTVYLFLNADPFSFEKMFCPKFLKMEFHNLKFVCRKAYKSA